MDDALALVSDAYQTRLRRSGRSAQHPILVGLLLAADGQLSSVVVTGLLHDVLEDTEVSAGELHDRFGDEISRSVQALTQDPSIAKYRSRKAALRTQVLAGGRRVAAVSIVDKLATLRGRAKRPAGRRLLHYRASLEEIEHRYGRSGLSEQLRFELARWPER